jgi:hypothetical protein
MSNAESDIYFYAFRYCLGRMTYAVSDFCRQATAKVAELGTHQLEMMDKEITEAERQDTDDRIRERCVKALGWDCDREMWLKLRETIRKELKARQA